MRKTKFYAGNYYHLYNRGVNKQAIFYTKENWIFFLKRLREYFKPDRIEILAYCLMPNQYHLLVYLKTDQLRKIMQPFAVSYTKSINNQEKRVGPLFQGPFQGEHVDSQGYLTHLSRYIHLNPVAAGYVKTPAEWIYSSYREYIGTRQGTLPNTDFILSLFESRRDYRSFVESKDEPYANIPQHLLMD